MARPSLLVLGFLVGLVVGCGGSTASGDGSGGDGSGGVGLRGAATGGSGATSSGGTGAGGGGSGGAQPAERCLQPIDAGTCTGYWERWGFDAELGACVAFVYGGCGTSENEFESRAECEAACGVADLTSCEGDADCALASAGCCGACEPVTSDAYVAVRTEVAADYPEVLGCLGVACGACLEVPETAHTSQYFRAACVEGTCAVRDIRQEPVTECNVAADCTLRCGAGCCESCGGGLDVVALSASADLVEALCGGAPVPCPTCDCVLPSHFTADCVAGRCVVSATQVCDPDFVASCNLLPEMSSIAGTCNADGTCTCAAGRTQDPVTGLCY